MGMLRIFLALELPPSIKGQLRILQGEFAFLDQDIKWVPEANLHITLHFLGSLPEERIPQVCTCAKAVGQGVRPFTVEVGGLGVFPPRGKSRVFWAGIGRGREELQELYTNLGVRLAAAGFAIEKRPYIPHITLGRFRKPPVAAARLQGEIKKGEGTIYGGFTARDLVLFQSILTPRGPIYKVKQRIHLGR